MKLYILTTAFFATFFLISCKKDNEVNLSKTDYIIFGHFYGECIGEQCVKILSWIKKNSLKTQNAYIRPEIVFMKEDSINYQKRI